MIDTVNMNLLLPPYREARFQEILSTIPYTQNIIGVNKWHQVLGDLKSKAITFPRSRGLFFQMKEDVRHINSRSVALTKGVYQALAYFL